MSSDRFLSDETKHPWPIAISDYHLLEPTAPAYTRCVFCPSMALIKCAFCSTPLCLQHQERIVVEDEWCVSTPEKAYYANLVLCTECKEKEAGRRSLRVMSTIFVVVLIFIFFMIFSILHNA